MLTNPWHLSVTALTDGSLHQHQKTIFSKLNPIFIRQAKK
jgi:hypothetical protein